MSGRRSPTYFALLATVMALADAAEAAGHVFSRRFGNVSDQAITSVVVDGGGSAIVTGLFSGTIDFGGGSLVSSGSDDVFVARLDAGGNHVWSKAFGDAGAQAGNGVAVDASGNVYLTGYFNGSIDFGGGNLTSAGGQDIFVVRLDAAGNHAWSKRFGNSSNQAGGGIAVDATGNVIVVGTFSGSVDFGGGTLTSAGSTDACIAKLAPDGDHVWSKAFGDATAQSGIAVAVDGDGNVFATGAFAGTVNFGGGDLTSAGSTDVFVARLTSAGEHAWSRRFGDASGQTGIALSVDASGGPVIAGSFSGSVNFGGTTLTSAGSTDGFVAKLDAAGIHAWSRSFGGTGTDSSNGVAVHGAGDVVVTGGFQGSADFGGGPLVSAGATDVFVARYDAVGIHLTSSRAGDSTEQEGRTSAFDAPGNALVAGRLQGTADFGGGVLTSAGGFDAFLAKLALGKSLHPVPPCRVVDTRNGAGPLGGPALAAGPSERVFPISGTCGIPDTARAVAVNLTVTEAAAPGQLRLYPGDTAVGWIPVTTSISFGALKTRANNAVGLLSRDGAGSLGVRNDAPGTVHFILDVVGYFD
jgi:hypothetical protein